MSWQVELKQPSLQGDHYPDPPVFAAVVAWRIEPPQEPGWPATGWALVADPETRELSVMAIVVSEKRRLFPLWGLIAWVSQETGAPMPADPGVQSQPSVTCPMAALIRNARG